MSKANSLTKQTPPRAHSCKAGERIAAGADAGAAGESGDQASYSTGSPHPSPREESQALPQARDVPLPDAGHARTAVSIS